MILLFITIARAEPLSLVPELTDIYRSFNPPKIAKANSLKLAQDYADSLDNLQPTENQKEYNGGILVRYQGFKVFLANTKVFVASAADYLISLFRTHVTPEAARKRQEEEQAEAERKKEEETEAKRKAQEAADNNPQFMPIQKKMAFSIYEESRTLTKPTQYLGQPYVERLYQQIDPKTMLKLFNQDDFFQLIGLQNKPQNILCDVIPGAVGEETAGVFELNVDGEKIIVKQSLDNQENSLGDKQFKNFEMIGQRYGRFVPQFPIQDGPIIVELALPICFLKVKDSGLYSKRFAYLEVLRRAKGVPAKTWLSSSKRSDSFFLLGKVLGMVHQKLGKFNNNRLEEVPALDYQLKNIFVSENNGQITFTLIDLGRMAQQVKLEDEFIKELELINSEAPQEKPNQYEEFLEGYNSILHLDVVTKVADEVKQERELREHEYGLMLQTLKDLKVDIDRSYVSVDGTARKINPSRWREIAELYKRPKLEIMTLNLIKDVILKLKILGLEKLYNFENKEKDGGSRETMDKIIAWPNTETENNLREMLTEILKKQDFQIKEEADKKERIRREQEEWKEKLKLGNVWQIKLNDQDMFFEMPQILKTDMEKNLMRAFMALLPDIQKLVDRKKLTPKEYNTFLRALSMSITIHTIAKSFAERARQDMSQSSVAINFLYVSDILKRKMEGEHLGSSVLIDKCLIFPELIMKEDSLIPETRTDLLVHMDNTRIIVDNKAQSPWQVPKTDQNLDKFYQIVLQQCTSPAEQLFKVLSQLRPRLVSNYDAHSQLVDLIKSPLHKCFDGSLDPMLRKTSELISVFFSDFTPLRKACNQIPLLVQTNQPAFRPILENKFYIDFEKNLERLCTGFFKNSTKQDSDQKYEELRIDLTKSTFDSAGFSQALSSLLTREIIEKLKGKITEGEVVELIFWTQFVDPEKVKSFPKVLIEQDVTL